MASNPLPARRSELPQLLVLGCVLVLAAELSRLLSVDVANMSAIWPPLGIAIGAGLLLPTRILPVYALALGGWMLWRDYSGSLILLVLLEQCVQCALAVFLLRRYLRRAPLLDNLADTLRFYLWGAALPLLPICLLTTALLFSQGLFAGFSFVDLWLVYWLSEAVGVLLFAPLAQHWLWSLSRGRPPLEVDSRGLKFAGLLLLLVVLSVAALLNGYQDYGKALTYLLFPLLAWVSMSGRNGLALLAMPLVALVLLGYVLLSVRLLHLSAGFLLVEAVLIISMLTLMSQLILAVSTERRRLLQRFREQARRDLNTGLLNDRGLLQLIQAGRHAAPQGRHLVGIFALQHFADAQDLLEPGFVRELESSLGKRIGERLGAVPVARVGPGQLAFYWSGAGDSAIDAAMDRLLQDLQNYSFSRAGSLYVLSAALGVIELQAQDADDVLLSAAGQAARHAARQVDHPLFCCTLDDPIIRARQSKLAALEEIKAALGDNRFLLYAQEIRPLQPGGGTPRHEVLLRMLDRQGRLVSPEHFVPVAQDYGLMGQMDRWVVQATFDWLAEHPAARVASVRLGINLSGATLADPGFPQWIEAQLARTGMDPQRVGFEVTESQQIADWAVACRLLERLRVLGFSISLDDFGTGLAGFDYLTRFPFDTLKIDGSFIHDIDSKPVSQAIVASITRVAATMGLQTVAEYVDDAGVLDLLATLGVDHAQGYAVGRPLPLAELLKS
jgi:EAL domain-containing protein (putative c-di-GMP-specific phosphodiesterase class I)/integral membrane sensor domain MASE1